MRVVSLISASDRERRRVAGGRGTASESSNEGEGAAAGAATGAEASKDSGGEEKVEERRGRGAVESSEDVAVGSARAWEEEVGAAEQEGG